MDIGNQQTRSHLLLLRMWSENETGRHDEWLARVQHVFTGEARTFQACPQLVELLMEMLTKDAQPDPSE